jgi:uroporphyrinogen-III synthase
MVRSRGWQALVTRPSDESESVAAALAARGVEAVIEPLMEIHFRAPEGLDLAGVQAVLCTSANGVRALARATGERGMPLLAVGDATASCARSAGFTAVESAAGDRDDLVRLATARLRPQRGPLLHVAGNVLAGDLAGTLRNRGFTVERNVLYEARPAAALSSKAVMKLRRGAIDFALFFSPRTGEIFVRLARVAGVAESCGTITALSISRAADAALANLVWLDRRAAERPTRQALLDMLDRVLGERQRA